VGDIDLKVISAAENSNKFQKTRFWKEKSVDEHLNVYHSIQIVMCIWCCRKHLAMGYKDTLQNNVICCVHPKL
jgi:hypothetical protein